LTDQDIEQKFMELSARAQTGCAQKKLIRSVWDIEKLDNAGTLMALARQA
jgi:hypothetical protein